MQDKKVIIGIALVTALILGGGIFFLGNSPSKAKVEKVAGAKIEISENSFDFKDIPYSGGLAIHEFPIKNSGEKEVSIVNMTTSCMCTTVSLKTAGGESPQFGMAGHTPVTSWKGILKPGEEGKVVVTFDPTAHGPSGVGPISRLVSFETSDPDHPYVELSFQGNVIKDK